MSKKWNKNRLLGALEAEDRKLIRDHLRPLQLTAGSVLCEPYQRLLEVYFPVDCMISLFSVTSDGDSLEIGTIGNEGFVGVAAFLGPEVVPYRVAVNVSGMAYALSVATLKQLACTTDTIQRKIHAYIHYTLNQVTQTAICNRFHSVEERLARWLLLTMDRTDSKHFPYTHDFLAGVLGTRRVSVTLTIGNLQKVGILKHDRGTLSVLDREKLETVACECYGITSLELRGLISSIERVR